jgi:hypothetical protein
MPPHPAPLTFFPLTRSPRSPASQRVYAQARKKVGKEGGTIGDDVDITNGCGSNLGLSPLQDILSFLEATIQVRILVIMDHH